MMPESIKWPRDEDNAPLHFIAQICCADLPESLWNGSGPRKGWLLLFLETMKFRDFAESPIVQVLHIERLGAERQPPEDAPTVRHTMSEYLECSSPSIRPGVPKFWRKWPIDIIADEYVISNEEQQSRNSLLIEAEKLYDGPASSTGMSADFDGLDRPLTWRGALYVVEGVLRDLENEEFKKHNMGNRGGLFERSIGDQGVFNKLVAQKVAQRPELDGMIVHLPRRALVERELEVQIELPSEQLSKSYPFINSQIAKIKQELNAYRAVADEPGLHETKVDDHVLASKLEYLERKIVSMEECRDYLAELFARSSSSEVDGGLSAKIPVLDQDHLAWAEHKRLQLQAIYREIEAKNLDVFISETDWSSVQKAITGDSCEAWRGPFMVEGKWVLKKVETRISIDRHLRMAIREDILDLYTSSSESYSALSKEQIEELEPRLRYFEDGLMHCMGRMPAFSHDEVLNPSNVLLVQLASDRAIGWLWGDYGTCCLAIKDRDLQRDLFTSVEAWIQDHHT